MYMLPPPWRNSQLEAGAGTRRATVDRCFSPQPVVGLRPPQQGGATAFRPAPRTGRWQRAARPHGAPGRSGTSLRGTDLLVEDRMSGAPDDLPHKLRKFDWCAMSLPPPLLYLAVRRSPTARQFDAGRSFLSHRAFYCAAGGRYRSAMLINLDRASLPDLWGKLPLHLALGGRQITPLAIVRDLLLVPPPPLPPKREKTHLPPSPSAGLAVPRQRGTDAPQNPQPVSAPV